MRACLLSFCVALLAACGGGGSDPAPSDPPDPAAAGPFGFSAVFFETLRDEGRGRDVPTTVYLPASGGARPLVVLSHGAGGTRTSYTYLAEHLASHGFVVAVPEHVGSNNTGILAIRDAQGITYAEAVAVATSDPAEYQARAADVTFLVDQATTWHGAHALLAGRIDVARVAVVGHSYGAFTALVAGGALAGLPRGLTSLADPRVDTIVALSPQGTGSTGDFEATSFAPVVVPALMMAGSEDGGQNGLPPSWRRECYDLMLPGDKVFASLENTNHLHFAQGFATAARMDTHHIVRALAVAFLYVHLQVYPAADVYVNEAYADALVGAAVPDVAWSAK